MIKKIVLVIAMGVQFVSAMNVSKTQAIPECYPCDDKKPAMVSAIPECYPCDDKKPVAVAAIPECYPCDDKKP